MRWEEIENVVFNRPVTKMKSVLALNESESEMSMSPTVRLHPLNTLFPADGEAGEKVLKGQVYNS